MTPTRAELEAMVDAAGRALRRECERFVERHRPYDLEAAMRAYGAACQALGEQRGKESTRDLLHLEVTRAEAERVRAEQAYGRGWNEACEEHDVIDAEVRMQRLRARAEQAEAEAAALREFWASYQSWSNCAHPHHDDELACYDCGLALSKAEQQCQAALDATQGVGP